MVKNIQYCEWNFSNLTVNKPFINQLQRLTSFNIIIRLWHKFNWKAKKKAFWISSCQQFQLVMQRRRNQYEEVLKIFWVLYQKWNLDSPVPTKMFIELWNPSDRLIQVKLKVCIFFFLFNELNAFVSKGKDPKKWSKTQSSYRSRQRYS